MKKKILLLISISIPVLLFSQPANDNVAGAITLTHSANNCSANAAYTTIAATADGNSGSCWENGPNYTVWFKFVATTTEVTLNLKVGGAFGTMQHPNMALWESDATTEIACVRRIDSYTDVQISKSGLTVGNTYYISVDNYVGLGYRGTFSLCIDNTVNYDEPAGAVTLVHSANNCSANAAYSTLFATTDGLKGSCWENGPNYTRWFKFVATSSNVTLDLKVGGAYGTMQHPNMALWESDATTEVACVRRIDSYTDVQISKSGLTVGNTYYISVDNYVGLSYRGTFTLCIDNTVNYDEPAGAVTLVHSANNCSANAAYSTMFATADGLKGSCWENGPNYTRWFKFVATSSNVTLDLKVGGAFGTMQHPNMALWESDATTEVACVRRIDSYTDVQISKSGLIVGNTYYISVDNYVGLGYRGTFSLCIDNTVNYDEPAGAVTLIHSTNNCSANAAYSTMFATADGLKGSCWENGPNYTRWFKFVATNNELTLDLKVGGVYGTMQHPNMALWESDATTEVACVRRIDSYTDVQIVYSNLVVGNTYYVSVDNYVGAAYQGTFTICISDQSNYDNISGALTLVHTSNNCSSNSAYTTINATSDGLKGSCWENGPNYTRWFKFVATTPYVTLDLKVGGAYGTMQHPNMALWESDATTEIACVRRIDSYTDVQISYPSLVIGNTYYVSVDNYVGLGYRGTFSLCIDNTVDYDYSLGAIELTDLNNWCSANAAYTTINATPDGLKGSCWENGPNYTRWFKFVAVSPNVTVQMKTGGAEGNLQHPNVALWESDATTQVACTKRTSAYADVSMSSGALVVGNTYYISCDNYVGTSYRGTFSLCIDNVDTEYYSIADGNWNNPNNWSIVYHNGPAAASYPTSGDIAYIRGNSITVPTVEAAAEVIMNDSSYAPTNITINGGTLNIAGKMSFTNSGTNLDQIIAVTVNGKLNINDNLTLNRAGGNNLFDLTVANGCSVTVNKDFIINSSGGGTNNNQVIINGNGTLTVNRDFLLTETGGIKTFIQMNNTSKLNAKRDIQITATTDNKIAFELNNTSTLSIGRNFKRGTPAYGILTSNNTSTVNYNGTMYSQTVASGGSGTGDVISYKNLVFNNTHITVPQLTISGGNLAVENQLTLTSGIVKTTSSNLLIMNNGTTTSGGSSTSYIDGPIRKIGTSAYTFHVGKGGFYAPIKISAPSVATDYFTAEYYNADPTPLYNTALHDVSINHLSTIEYWTLDRAGTSNVNVTLTWDTPRSGIIDTIANLVVARWNGTTWKDHGNGGTTGNTTAGSVISSAPVTSFSPFTLASTTTANPLPVKLVLFDANSTKNSVWLTWQTETEINNDYFTVERSSDLTNWETIKQVQGAGNSNSKLNYAAVDQKPLNGISYYRLKQTDFNGEYSYSDIRSINYNSIGDFTVYPNPVKDKLTIKSNCKDCLVSIFSSMGQKIYSGSDFELDTKNWASGVYEVVIINNEGNSFVTKIIK
ncbi:MAG: T9SS type A sorting domain-containing protein [Flavobacteriales bacterium]|nr:T9SS type A sorting domain-containing protein [Flavobacteriales bacterium]